MINVLWHITDGFWDSAFPRYLLNRTTECAHHIGIGRVDVFSVEKVGVIVVPGQHSVDNYDFLNHAAMQFERVVFLITGDEEGKFQVDKLEHPNQKTWWFAPPLMPTQKVNRVAPFGWPGDAEELIARARRHSNRRIYDYSFAGQVTHDRRKECLNAASQMTGNGFLYHTKGFAQGLPREDYYDFMVRSKFVLCPSGPCIADSFRFAEALEAGCVPIVDAVAPRVGYPEGYWDYIFDDELPFPVVSDWATLPDLFSKLLPEFEARQLRCEKWWKMQKDRYVEQLREDLCLT